MASRSGKKDTKNNYFNSSISRKATPSNKDQLWKDMLEHEKQLDNLWHWKWDFLFQPEFLTSFASCEGTEGCTRRNVQFDVKTGDSSSSRLNKPSPPIPAKTSEFIGWRSTDPSNTFNLYCTTPSRPQKIRFRDEQYGKYRHRKYLQENTCKQNLPLPPILTSAKVTHKVKPLLC